eukprot:jgi/Pico_ML_1/52195/g2934.t1
MARQEIPLARLRTRAARMAKRGGALDEEEALLRQLLAWFKREFFAWIDRPRNIAADQEREMWRMGAGVCTLLPKPWVRDEMGA